MVDFVTTNLTIIGAIASILAFIISIISIFKSISAKKASKKTKKFMLNLYGKNKLLVYTLPKLKNVKDLLEYIIEDLTATTPTKAQDKINQNTNQCISLLSLQKSTLEILDYKNKSKDIESIKEKLENSFDSPLETKNYREMVDGLNKIIAEIENFEEHRNE
ncbi:MAG: hypothetical protein ACOC56_04795 [Atribacterota bacterium]